MAFNKIHGISVGAEFIAHTADSSALSGFHDIPPILFISLIGLGKVVTCKLL
jgi:hypothetical protein